MKLFFVLFFFMLYTTLSGMNTFEVLPKDVVNNILVVLCPSMDVLFYNEVEYKDIIKNLPVMAHHIISLRSVCQHFNTFITHNITSIFSLNKMNIDTFFIRSMQADVPYFVKYAVEYEVNNPIVYKPNGFTALLYAAENNSYHACKLLLSKGVDVNLKMRSINAFGYCQSPYCNWPIHMAVKKGDARLVTLFAQAGAKLNIRINNDLSYTLLKEAALRNEPEILKDLLTFGTDADYSNSGIKHGIESALEIAIEKKTQEQNVEYLHKNEQIIALLKDVQERGY